MIPTNLVGLVLFALVLAPGWIWVRVAERRELRAERSSLLEAAELVVTGVIFTAAAAMLVAWIGDETGRLPGLRAITASGSTYMQERPYSAAAAGAAVFVLSLAAAYVVARFVYRGKEPAITPAGSVWRDVFVRGGRDTRVFVSVSLVNGTIVEGYLFSYPTDSPGSDRDIALQKPIYTWSGEPPKRTEVPADRAVIRSEQVVAMWVRYESADN